MRDLDIAELGTILGVWAHPDDEAYLSGGLMAAARDAGNRVAVVTATRGEAGTADPANWPPHRLARVREAELHASLAALGVTEHRFLDHVDGTLPDVDMAGPIARIADIIAEVRPDTILTFGPDGLTGHSDHRRVSTWATVACEVAAPGARLLYAAMTAEHVDRWRHVHDRFNIFMDPDLPLRLPADRVALRVDLDGAQVDRKLVALRAQASQTTGLIAAMGEDDYRGWIATETFRTAPALVPAPARRERALATMARIV